MFSHFFLPFFYLLEIFATFRKAHFSGFKVPMGMAKFTFPTFADMFVIRDFSATKVRNEFCPITFLRLIWTNLDIIQPGLLHFPYF